MKWNGLRHDSQGKMICWQLQRPRSLATKTIRAFLSGNRGMSRLFPSKNPPPIIPILFSSKRPGSLNGFIFDGLSCVSRLMSVWFWNIQRRLVDLWIWIASRDLTVGTGGAGPPRISRELSSSMFGCDGWLFSPSSPEGKYDFSLRDNSLYL